jgi:hypothetical protein
MVAARELGLETSRGAEPVSRFLEIAWEKKSKEATTVRYLYCPAPIDKKSRAPWLALHLNLTTTFPSTPSPIPSSPFTVLYPSYVRLEIDQTTLLSTVFKAWESG